VILCLEGTSQAILGSSDQRKVPASVSLRLKSEKIPTLLYLGKGHEYRSFYDFRPVPSTCSLGLRDSGIDLKSRTQALLLSHLRLQSIFIWFYFTCFGFLVLLSRASPRCENCARFLRENQSRHLVFLDWRLCFLFAEWIVYFVSVQRMEIACVFAWTYFAPYHELEQEAQTITVGGGGGAVRAWTRTFEDWWTPTPSSSRNCELLFSPDTYPFEEEGFFARMAAWLWSLIEVCLFASICVHAEKSEMKECHEQIGLAVMGAVKSCSKKRDGAVAAIAAAHRSVDGGIIAAMGKGKGVGSKLSITSYAISDTFLPFRIALVSLILFLGVAAFLFSRGLVPFLSLAPAALLEKMDRIRVYEYEIVHEFPHHPTAFTQVWFLVFSTHSRCVNASSIQALSLSHSLAVSSLQNIQL